MSAFLFVCIYPYVCTTKRIHRIELWSACIHNKPIDRILREPYAPLGLWEPNVINWEIEQQLFTFFIAIFSNQCCLFHDFSIISREALFNFFKLFIIEIKKELSNHKSKYNGCSSEVIKINKLSRNRFYGYCDAMECWMLYNYALK